MDSVSCDFADYDHLLRYLVDNQTTGENAALLVKACDTVCPLLLGSSNPDVSGIGAMISYVIQGVAVFIASGIFQTSIMFSYWGPEKPRSRITALTRLTEIPSPIVRSFYKLADTTHKTSIALCVAVMTAAVTRVFQDDVSYVEMFMLVLISMYQFFLGAMSLQFYIFCDPEAFSFWANSPFSSATSPRPHLRRWWWFWHRERPPLIFFPALFTLYSYCMLVTIIVSVTAKMNQETPLHARVLRDISSACTNERGFPPTQYLQYNTPFSSPSDLVRRQSFSILTVCIQFPFSAFAYSILLIGVWFVGWCAEEADVDAPKLFFALAWPSTTKWLFLPFTALTLSLQGSSMSWMVTKAWIIRSALLKAQGPSENEDSRWGFGQVAAVLMWAPLAQDIITLAWEQIALPRHARTRNAKRTDDIEAGTNSESDPLSSATASDTVIADVAFPISKASGPGRQRYTVLKRAATS